MTGQHTCFIVMPFRPELNFLFLFLQRYLNERHGLVVKRGDTKILTKSLIDKIDHEIQAADLIIGDISFSSPNVFYELGLARAYGKPVILLTQEVPEAAPVDLRQFEFIHYDLTRDRELLSKLDNAIGNVMGEGYAELYQQSIVLLQKFNADTASTYAAAPLEKFQARVVRGENLEGIPAPVDQGYQEFFLPKIIADATDFGVIRKVNVWLAGAKSDKGDD